MPSLMIAPDVATMNSDVNALDARLKTFAVSSEVLMNVLDKVAKVHPYISGKTALAFPQYCKALTVKQTPCSSSKLSSPSS
jgi:hypothetical protein